MSETSPVRAGEEIDTESLSEYLRARIGSDKAEVQISQFPAGSSNLTYLIRRVPEEFVLRRPPFGNTIKTAHDMRREFEVLSKLSAVYPPAPKPILYCDDTSVIDSEFYVMERRNGIIIRGSTPSELENSIDLQNRVGRSFISNLAELHKIDYVAAGLGELGKPEGYVRRQVDGWTKRYATAQTDEVPELGQTIDWLNENQPAESGAALIHNDYKFDNIMLDPDDLTRITAVLDWEMVTVGDPLMDLGTTLGYWMSREVGEQLLNMPFNPRVLMENISRRELVEMYSEYSGRDIPEALFYYIFGTFKIAVIAQQIYARYRKRFTKDERFANFNVFVAALARIAARAIEKQQL